MTTEASRTLELDDIQNGVLHPRPPYKYRFLTRGTGMFPRSAFLSFATFLFLVRFLLVHS